MLACRDHLVIQSEAKDLNTFILCIQILRFIS